MHNKFTVVKAKCPRQTAAYLARIYNGRNVTDFSLLNCALQILLLN